MKYIHKGFLQFHETIRGSGRLMLREVWDKVGGFKDIITCDTYLDLELLRSGLKTKVVNDVYQYDLRDYTLRQLTVRAIRRGKGRKQIGQSFFFMIGHGLYTLMNNPFGIIELAGNIAGYMSTKRRVSRETMRRYESNRISDVIDNKF
jgi:cellulose synthase/poly-beta-1,6-N-acetylglucosamine synthase-like glycosyltransferase